MPDFTPDLPITTLNVNGLTASASIVAGHQWLTPVILATWEAEIRRIMVRG
jgi:hypothetical protein